MAIIAIRNINVVPTIQDKSVEHNTVLTKTEKAVNTTVIQREEGTTRDITEDEVIKIVKTIKNRRAARKDKIVLYS